MLRLIIKGLLWQMLLLASLGWLITGCDKEGAADIEPFQDQLVENASIEMIDGRLLFNNKAHFDQTLARMAKSETVDLPERFISYYETYNSIVNNDMSDEQFINFVESPEFQRYFRVLEDQEGLKSMEPIWSSKLFGQVLSKNLKSRLEQM